MNLLIAVLLQVWQLPQNLVGLVFGWFLKGKERHPGIQGLPRGIRLISGANMHGGISLGSFVYFRKPSYDRLLRHEAGHCRQSRLLGPLYLPVIGLPSLLWALWWHPGRPVPYSWFYTERWADRLGGLTP
ncbi:MAG: hypothetical protein IKG84_08595 [Bacteroidales bacterium]|nr:hypothetical protein [Bacteroidales bacterium]